MFLISSNIVNMTLNIYNSFLILFTEFFGANVRNSGTTHEANAFMNFKAHCSLLSYARALDCGTKDHLPMWRL